MTATALRALAPGPEDTALLRACLPTGDPGREAFERWAARLRDPVEALRDAPPRVRALLPVLLGAAEANGARVERSLTKVMRAAWTHEELRARVFEAACADVLTALDEPAIVLPGVALAATVYGSWPLRHCHDLDLLVRSEPRRSVHPSGTPAVRHTVLADDPWIAPPVDAAWRRAVRARVAGVDALVLSDADALVHVCVHAATRLAPPQPRWALDAWWLAARGEVSWEVVVELATARRAPVLGALIGWLADELEAPVPPGALAELRGRARAADLASRELALSLARRRVGAAGLVRHAGRDAPLAIRALLAPSREYLGLRGVARGPWMRRGAARMISRGAPEATRSPPEWSPDRARRAAGTPAPPPQAR